jgi:hypothetical protein
MNGAAKVQAGDAPADGDAMDACPRDKADYSVYGAVMPLPYGGRSVEANFHELYHHGSRPRSRKQIIAIALNAARRARRKGHRRSSRSR